MQTMKHESSFCENLLVNITISDTEEQDFESKSENLSGDSPKLGSKRSKTWVIRFGYENQEIKDSSVVPFSEGQKLPQ